MVLFADAPWNLADQRTKAPELSFSIIPATSLPSPFQVIIMETIKIIDGDKHDDNDHDDEIFHHHHHHDDDQGSLPTGLPWTSLARTQIPPTLWRTKGDISTIADIDIDDIYSSDHEKKQVGGAFPPGPPPFAPHLAEQVNFKQNYVYFSLVWYFL